jgi:hypothetical protein
MHPVQKEQKKEEEKIEPRSEVKKMCVFRVVNNLEHDNFFFIYLPSLITIHHNLLASSISLRAAALNHFWL